MKVVGALSMVALQFLSCVNPVAEVETGQEIDITAHQHLVLARFNATGTRIVAREAYGSEPDSVFVFDSNGENLHVVTVSPGEEIYSHGWMRNGDEILVSGLRFVDSAFIQGLWRRNLASGEEVRIPMDSGEFGLMYHVSPFADSVAFIFDNRIRVMSSYGGPSKPLVTIQSFDPYPDAQLSWSGDGSEIFASYYEIYSVNISTLELRPRLTRSFLSGTNSLAEWNNGEITNVACQPGGTWIAFNFFDYDGPVQRGLFLFNLADSSIQRPTEGGVPSWSPDGKWIVYSRDGRLLKRKVF